MVDHLGMAATLPAIRQVRVGPDGSLWVQRFAVKGDTALVDVFEPDGTYAGTLPEGTLFPAAFLPNGDPVFVARDDLDLSRVEIWRVVRPAGDR